MLLNLASLVFPEWGWNPETNLAVAERRIITLEEFRTGQVQIVDCWSRRLISRQKH